MIPKLVHAALLRKKGPEWPVMQTICRVENLRPCVSVPDKRIGVAPSILIFSPFADLILVVTEIRFDVG